MSTREAAPADDAAYGVVRAGAPRVALVHDWLVTFGGAESLLAELVRCVPAAPVHVLVDFFDAAQHRRLGAAQVHTSFVQRVPGARTRYWYYTPLMAAAVERFDLGAFDLVLSSSHAFAKGVLVGPDQLHVSYVHSPIRFAWDLQAYYLERFGWTSRAKQLAALAAFHYLRLWDARTPNGVDLMLCNSEFVRRRIQKTYRRRAHVVYPPIDVDRFAYADTKQDYYLTGSFMNPFKRLDLVVQAFSQMPARQLRVFGEGPDLARCRSLAGPNVQFLGRLDDDALVTQLQGARAFVFAAPEDFGMLMAEAQACGTPVIAYGYGGAREIVRELDQPAPTGTLFPAQTLASLRAAVERFERAEVLPEACRRNALRFSSARFRRQVRRILALSWQLWSSARWPADEAALFALLAEAASAHALPDSAVRPES
jgi:glycosyltransferase involved in cell wall biosynthesis